MIAIALREQIPGITSIQVTAETIRFNKDGQRRRYDTPARVAKALLEFDDSKPLGAFTFKLDARQLTMGPATKRGPNRGSGATSESKKSRKPQNVRRCKRRYRGILEIEEVGPSGE